ncbi:unnamed protein product [Amaranthus hypochondriacus]
MKGVRENERFPDEISPSTSNSNSLYHNAAGLPFPSVSASSNLFSYSNGYSIPDVGSSEVGLLDHSRYPMPESHMLDQTYVGSNLPDYYYSGMDENALIRGFENISMADVSSGIRQSHENPDVFRMSGYNVGQFGTSMTDNFGGFGFSSPVCRDTRNGTVKVESSYGLGQTMANQGRNPSYVVLDHQNSMLKYSLQETTPQRDEYHSDSFGGNPPPYFMQNHQNSLYNFPVQRTTHQGEDYNGNDRISVHHSLDPRTMYTYQVFCNSRADSQNLRMYRIAYNEAVGLNSQQTISMRNAVCNQKREKVRAFAHKRLNGTLRNGYQLRDDVLVSARDQEGSQYLQDVYEKGSLEDRQSIFDKVFHHIIELMMDTFANYLIQKMLCFSTDEQRIMIVNEATKEPGRLLRIAMNSHGTRVVQTMVECIKTREEILWVVHSLEPGFLDLMKDSNGNHVGQRCFEKLSSEDNKVFSLIALNHCIEIATHRFGCVVFQRCLSYSNAEVQQRLIKMICDNALMLARDPFGNYAVQYIMVEKLLKVPADLLNHFHGKYVNLSTQKFSSHVVEKCLLFVPESHQRIVYEWLTVPRLEQILQDPYANFVIQRALESIQGPLYKSLAAAIRPYQTRLRHNPYCRNIFNKGLLNK